jgi:hypothetical protein
MAVRAGWMCEDGQDAAQLGSVIAGQPAMKITGSPDLASNSDFVCCSALPDLNGSTWVGTVPQYTSNGAVVIRNLLEFTTTPAATAPVWSAGLTGGLLTEIRLEYSLSENSLEAWGLVGGNLLITTNPVTYPGLCAVSVELTQDGSYVQLNVAVMQPGQMTATESGTSSSSPNTGVPGNVTVVTVNPGSAGTFLGSGVIIGGIYVQDTYSDLSTMAGPLAAWAGENAANRFARLCAENGIQCRIFGFPGADIWNPVPSA